MATKSRRTFSGFFSQLAVVCLLGVFVMISLIAMFSTAGVPEEADWLGMTVETIGAEAADARGIPRDLGVLVGEAEGVAARSGILSGDVLIAVNGSRVGDVVDFNNIVDHTDITKGGVQLDVVRAGARMPVFVFPMAANVGKQGGTAPLPAGTAQAPGRASPGGMMPPPHIIDQRWLGIDAETLTAGDALELGVPIGTQGVLIDGVALGSKAERMGLNVNDVIVSVNGRSVVSTVHIWSTLAGLNSNDRVEFGIFRKGKLLALRLPTASGTLAGGLVGRRGGQGMGAGGSLICPVCQTRVTHQRGVACPTVACPACGTQMIRER